ncbi:SPASM domain-containing protein [Candidatus Auribacterota bacterium]
MKKYFKGTLSSHERKCYIGFNRIQCTQDSKIYMCAALEGSDEVSFGNIEKNSLESLWKSDKAANLRKEIKKNKCCCMQRCAYREDFENFEGLIEKIRHF